MPFKKKQEGSLRSYLTRGATGTFILKIAFIGLAFFTSLLLARLLGALGYGIYAYAMSWMFLLSVPAGVGLERLLVREVASYKTRSAWSLMHGILRWSNRIVLIVSGGLALIAATVIWHFSDRMEPSVVSALLIALFILPFNVLNHLRQAAMRGIKKVVVGQLPETLIRPLLFMALIGAAYMASGKNITAQKAIGINIVVAGIVFFIGTRLLQKYLPSSVKESPPEYQRKLWFQSALPLLFISGMNIINAQTDVIMLGTMKGAEMVGVYNIAKKTSEIIMFVLLSVNMVLAPTVVSLYAEGDMGRLQRVITKSSRVILTGSLPIALGLILFGYWVLLLFGDDFIHGKTVLTILSVGQLVNAAMGSVGMILVMTNYERDVAVGFGIAAGLNVVLNALLIPRW